MTYYEMVRVIGVRAQQFNYSAKPLVKGIDHLPSQKMAYLELISKMTPFVIKRILPGKKYEEWRISELRIVHVITDDFFLPGNFDWDALMRNADDNRIHGGSMEHIIVVKHEQDKTRQSIY